MNEISPMWFFIKELYAQEVSMKTMLIHTFVTAFSLLVTTSANAQWWKGKKPFNPHVAVEDLEKMSKDIEKEIRSSVGHKTDKAKKRAALEKDGWVVAYGKELRHEEYERFCVAVAASVAAENPGIAVAYVKELVAESIAKLSSSASREFGEELNKVAMSTLSKVIIDAIKDGRVTNVNLPQYKVQLGCVEYRHWESVVEVVPTYQPYLRAKRIDGKPMVTAIPDVKDLELFCAKGGSKVFVIQKVDGKTYKRHVPDRETMNGLKFRMSDVKDEETEFLDKIPNIADAIPSFKERPRAVSVADGGRVFLLSREGYSVHVPNRTTLSRLGYDISKVPAITQAEFNRYRAGTPLPALPE